MWKISVKSHDVRRGALLKIWATGQVHGQSSIPHQSSHWKMTGGHLHNIFSSYRLTMTIGVGSHNHEHRVHSTTRKADEIKNYHLHTCMPYQKSSLILLQLIVLPHVLEHLMNFI